MSTRTHWYSLVAAIGLTAAIASIARAQTSKYDVQPALEYATHDGDKLSGNLYVPKGAGTFPALVAVHGGGWQAGSATNYQFWGPYLAERGYVVFSIDYRLVRNGRKMYPEAVQDVRAAVQFLRSRGKALKVDPDRIGMIGDSAGAHLAALVALAGDSAPFASGHNDDRFAGVKTTVKACVCVYGVYDLAAQWEHDLVHRPFDMITQKFLGASLIDDRRLFFDASPMSYVTRGNNHTAFLLAWGTEDDIVDRRTQSDAFLIALKQAGFFVRSVVVPGAPHFWVSDPIEETDSFSGFLAPRLLRFLQERL
jgi:acetyl esterase/lipase